ncbi:MAG: hypothetical protein D6785_05935 [Planctomycetota bacterium]|nr:MAG: hypothetical protein D6785_05935 [Planctomycetota bacterium]
MRNWILFICFFIASCSSGPEINKNQTKNQNPKKSSQNAKNQPGSQEEKIPEIARVFQNKVSPSVVDEKFFLIREKEEWRRFKKGLDTCDGAYLVSIQKVEGDESKGFVLHCRIEQTYLTKNKAFQPEDIQLKVDSIKAAFNLPAEVLQGMKYVLLMKLEEQQQADEAIFYKAWWQLYPLAPSVEKELAKLQ